jgi:hypothetical protein
MQALFKKSEKWIGMIYILEIKVFFYFLRNNFLEKEKNLLHNILYRCIIIKCCEGCYFYNGEQLFLW